MGDDEKMRNGNIRGAKGRKQDETKVVRKKGESREGVVNKDKFTTE